MSDLDRLANDLQQEAIITPAAVRAVVVKGALNVEKDWKDRAAGLRAAPHYPASIGFDLDILSGVIQAVIGPDKDKNHLQGDLGNLIEFGSAKNPPHNDGGQALQAEDPRFVAAIHALGGRRL